MQDELSELLEATIYKEIASEAVYLAAQKQTSDTGARALMKRLAGEEKKHSEWLKELRERGVANGPWHSGPLTDLKLSPYLTGSDSLEGAGLQDTLTFAIRREQEAMDFYIRMCGSLREKLVKNVCVKLAQEELRHKSRLEMLYDDMFYEEDSTKVKMIS